MSEIKRDIVFSETEPADTRVLWLKESPLGNLVLQGYGPNGWEPVSNLEYIYFDVKDKEHNKKVYHQNGLDKLDGVKLAKITNGPTTEAYVWLEGYPNRLTQGMTINYVDGTKFDVVHYIPSYSGGISKNTFRVWQIEPTTSLLGNISDINDILKEVPKYRIDSLVSNLKNASYPYNNTSTTHLVTTGDIVCVYNRDVYRFPVCNVQFLDSSIYKGITFTILNGDSLQTYTIDYESSGNPYHTVSNLSLSEYTVYEKYRRLGGTKTESEFNQKLKELIDA